MGRYTYKNFATDKLRWTAGRFIGWSEPTGPLCAPYAGFQRKASMLWIPKYLLTAETREALLKEKNDVFDG